MAATALPIRGPIAGSTVYKDGKLVARDITLTLPSITFGLGEYKAMGSLEIPNPTQLDAMELAMTKAGIDRELASICQPGFSGFECRWAQDVMKPDGTTALEGCKAFFKAAPKGIPGLAVEMGSVSENEITLAVVRYQLFIAGQEILLADKLNGILKVNGVSYTSKLQSLL